MEYPRLEEADTRQYTYE